VRWRRRRAPWPEWKHEEWGDSRLRVVRGCWSWDFGDRVFADWPSCEERFAEIFSVRLVAVVEGAISKLVYFYFKVVKWLGE
jgi:hypothetical protein